MKRFPVCVRCVLAALVVAALPATVRADDDADVTGNWKFVVMMDDGQELESTVKFSKEDNDLKAAYKTANPFTGEDATGEVKGVKVDGNDVTLDVSLDLDGITLAVTFTGTVDGDTMKGTAAYDLDGQAGELPFEGSRVKTSVVGKWELVATMDGQEIPTTLSITEKDGKLEGAFVGMDGTEGKVEELKLEGDHLSTKVSVDFQGIDLKINFDGTVDGEKITGTVNYDLDGQTGELDLVGKLIKPEVVGTWDLVATMDGQEIPAKMKIEDEDGKLAATFITEDGTEAKVEEIALNGSELDGKVTVDFQGVPLKLTFNAAVIDDSISGTISYDLDGQTGDLDLTGKLIKANPIGEWTFTVVTDDGQELVSTIAISEEDGELVGAFTAQDGTKGKVEEIAVEGTHLSTSVALELDGAPLKAKFKGDVDGDSIKGTVEYDLDGQIGELDFSGKREAADSAEEKEEEEAASK